MKKIVLLASLILCLVATSFAQKELVEVPGTPQGCTSITVGKDASADGSVMTSHTCDGYYRTWMDIKKGQKFDNDTTRQILKGIMHTENAWTMDGVDIAGTIPQAKQTFAYLNTAYPCMNEKQLAMGETTFGGRKSLRNKKGMFMIEELQAVALERCSTARQAITLIGELIAEYGYGDGGECITIADKNEVWQMEITGEGPDNIGGLWVAQRIPDDHVCVSANIARIAEVDFDNADYFMYTKDLKKKAKKLKLWDGKEPFIFYNIIADNKRQFSIREYYVFTKLAPSLNLDFTAKALPFSIKPEHKVTTKEMFAFFRETYEDTEWAMGKNLLITKKLKNEDGTTRDTLIPSNLATGWLSRDQVKLYNSLKDTVVQKYRPISVRFCAYSFISQCRNWLPDEIGGVTWMSFDVAALSPRTPIYSGSLTVPPSFKICGQARFTDDAAVWAYRKTNRLAMANWGKTRKYIEPNVMLFENKALREMPALEQEAKKLIEAGKTEEAQRLITDYTINFAESTMKRSEEISNTIWHLYTFGF